MGSRYRIRIRIVKHLWKQGARSKWVKKWPCFLCQTTHESNVMALQDDPARAPMSHKFSAPSLSRDVQTTPRCNRCKIDTFYGTVHKSSASWPRRTVTCNIFRFVSARQWRDSNGSKTNTKNLSLKLMNFACPTEKSFGLPSSCGI